MLPLEKVSYVAFRFPIKREHILAREHILIYFKIPTNHVCKRVGAHGVRMVFTCRCACACACVCVRVYLRRILAALGRARRDFGGGGKGWYGKGWECGGGRKCSLKRQEYGGSEAPSTLHVLNTHKFDVLTHPHGVHARVRACCLWCARTRTRTHTHHTHRI